MKVKLFNRTGKLFFVILILANVLVSIGCKGNVKGNEKSTPTISNNAILPRVSYADVVDKVAPSVVRITAEIKVKQQPQQMMDDDFFRRFFGQPSPQQPQRETGLGSGVIVNADGTILTNNHVVEGSDKIKVDLTDKRSFDAKIIGTDKASDLAVLKIVGKDLPVAAMGDSNQVRVGDVVLAIGNPLGLQQTVTAGIISAKGRATGLSDGSFEDFIQTDAPINRGNSGGALINTNGELIGINSQILSPSGGNIGIGFAIPSNMAKSVMEQLLKNGKVSRGRLGIGIQPVTSDIAETIGLKEVRGVIVNSVESGGAGDKAGLKQGDIIIALNGERIDDNNVLRNKIASTPPGTEVTLTIMRDGSEKQFKATLGEWSDVVAKNNQQDNPQSGGENSGKLGIAVEQMSAEIAKQLGVPPTTQGVVVTEVDPDGPAAEAGLTQGDIIVEINRQPVKSPDDLQKGLDKAGGKKSLLLINRRGQTVYLAVEPRG
jgi:Do/DeqQ family serine protease